MLDRIKTLDTNVEKKEKVTISGTWRHTYRPVNPWYCSFGATE